MYSMDSDIADSLALTLQVLVSSAPFRFVPITGAVCFMSFFWIYMGSSDLSLPGRNRLSIRLSCILN